MESLKKIINLNEAAKMSGYTPDYLGYLIRQGEMKGRKVGRSWVTTEEEVNNYIFKKKVRQNELAIDYFVSRKRVRNILNITCVLLILATIIVMFSQGEKTKVNIETNLSDSREVIDNIKYEIFD